MSAVIFFEGTVTTEFFAARLRELREKAGLTQPALAERAGMHKLGIAQLEQGRRKPTWATVVALAEALGVTCEAFLHPPADREPAGPGRPRKAEAELPAADAPTDKPSKGRKVSAAGKGVQESPAGADAAEGQRGGKKGTRKRKGK